MSQKINDVFQNDDNTDSGFVATLVQLNVDSGWGLAISASDSLIVVLNAMGLLSSPALMKTILTQLKSIGLDLPVDATTSDIFDLTDINAGFVNKLLNLNAEEDWDLSINELDDWETIAEALRTLVKDNSVLIATKLNAIGLDVAENATLADILTLENVEKSFVEDVVKTNNENAWGLTIGNSDNWTTVYNQLKKLKLNSNTQVIGTSGIVLDTIDEEEFNVICQVQQRSSTVSEEDFTDTSLDHYANQYARTYGNSFGVFEQGVDTPNETIEVENKIIPILGDTFSYRFLAYASNEVETLDYSVESKVEWLSNNGDILLTIDFDVNGTTSTNKAIVTTGSGIIYTLIGKFPTDASFIGNLYYTDGVLSLEERSLEKVEIRCDLEEATKIRVTAAVTSGGMSIPNERYLAFFKLAVQNCIPKTETVKDIMNKEEREIVLALLDTDLGNVNFGDIDHITSPGRIKNTLLEGIGDFSISNTNTTITGDVSIPLSLATKDHVLFGALTWHSDYSANMQLVYRDSVGNAVISFRFISANPGADFIPTYRIGNGSWIALPIPHIRLETRFQFLESSMKLTTVYDSTVNLIPLDNIDDITTINILGTASRNDYASAYETINGLSIERAQVLESTRLETSAEDFIFNENNSTNVESIISIASSVAEYRGNAELWTRSLGDCSETVIRGIFKVNGIDADANVKIGFRQDGVVYPAFTTGLSLKTSVDGSIVLEDEVKYYLQCTISEASNLVTATLTTGDYGDDGVLLLTNTQVFNDGTLPDFSELQMNFLLSDSYGGTDAYIAVYSLEVDA